jgi:hypothetical protein
MSIVLNVLIGVTIGMQLTCLYAMWRNNAVYKLRSRIAAVVFSKPDWEWRLGEYDSVSYGEMMSPRFWLKPMKVETFYSDTSFLK